MVKEYDPSTKLFVYSVFRIRVQLIRNYTAPVIFGKVLIARNYATPNLAANCPITRLSSVFDHGRLKPDVASFRHLVIVLWQKQGWKKNILGQ